MAQQQAGSAAGAPSPADAPGPLTPAPATVLDIVVDTVVEQGAEVVFGVLGDGNLQLAAALVARGVRWVSARHEAGATAMADGWSRRTGRTGVASVTHGPGLTNAATSLTAARLGRTPLVLLAGDTPRTTRHHGQDIDQAPFAVATAGCFLPVRLPATAAEDVALAFRRARTDPGPVVLNLPTDLQAAPAVAGSRPPPWSSPSRTPLDPPPGMAERVAALLAGADHPLVLAGRGALDAREDLLALADVAGAWVGTSLLAHGLFRGRPNDLGVVGGFSSHAVRAVLAEVDLVLAFGASLNRFTTVGGRVCPQAHWVQFDTDRHAFGDVIAVEPVLADAARAAGAVREQLTATSPTPRQAPPRGPAPGRETGRPSTGVDPRLALAAVDTAVPSARNVVVGIGHYSGWGALLVEVEDPRDLVLPWHLGSVGQALGIATGVAVASPDRPTVLVEGDGGVLMNPAELDTLAREGLPVLVVVLDDAAYGAEVHLLRRFGRSDELATFPRRDLAGLARSMGMRAATAVTAVELAPALATLHPFDGPALLHVHSDREVVHEEIFSALEG